MPQTKPDFESITRGRQEVDAIEQVNRDEVRQKIIMEHNKKIDEGMKDLRVSALLETLADLESGGNYDVIVGGDRFNNMAQHPNKADPRKNSVAGAFQFIEKTWDRNAEEIGVKDFSKESQDRVAIHLLTKLGAIDFLSKDDVEAAVMAAGKEWDIFPKNSSGINIGGKKRSMPKIVEAYRKRLELLKGE